jgi:RNA polymerase sigma-70 factor (ECF subfamily)
MSHPPRPAIDNDTSLLGPSARGSTISAVPVAARSLDPRDLAVWERRTVARLQAGDDAALREVFDQYGAFVFGLAQRVTANRALAEDITQDVFVYVWTNAHRIDLGVGSLRSYLGVVTHRRAVDVVRSEESRKSREAREAEKAPLDTVDIGEQTVAVAQADMVRAALDTLPDEQRQIVIMTYLDGRSYREVAIELGIPEGTAKSRGRLALAKLAASLAAVGVSA